MARIVAPKKIICKLKINMTSILTRYQIYFNYIREHHCIANKMLAEKCGINVEGITNGSN
jgi:hypothetical protein